MSTEWFTNGEVKEAAGALMGGALGRLIAFSVNKNKPSWIALLWEIPMAIGLGVAGAALADLMNLTGFQHLATSIAVAYTGPRALEIWIQTKVKK